MHGNVGEWCEDVYSDKLPGGTDPTNSTITAGGGRVHRGSSWGSRAMYGGTAYRKDDGPTYCSSGLGFRLALRPAP